jgi:hypothetical protein
MRKIYSVLLVMILYAAFGCREKYTIEPRSSDLSVLVVEGTLINGTQPTTIKLSKSTSFNRPSAIVPVTQAQVTVESNGGGVMSLTENPSTGNYIGTLSLDATKEYRLHIKTKEGKEYLSDFVPVKSSPAIDSINWKWENNGVMFYSNTHDATNRSKYYKWDYDETWEIISPYYSGFKMVGNVITPRTFPSEDVSHCWKFGTSNSIMIGSTAQLTSDVIAQVPLYYLSPNSEKIGVRYSVLVKQVVLTKEAYDFFYQMKKNTEQLGSIFDPLPSELRGNIHCVTAPDELVIGYVTASSQTEKRIFISSNQVSQWVYSYSGCNSLYVVNKPDSIKKYLTNGFTPYDQDLPDPFGLPIAYYFSLPPCSDCTLRGGTNIKPSYW